MGSTICQLQLSVLEFLLKLDLRLARALNLLVSVAHCAIFRESEVLCVCVEVGLGATNL
jgi:hypothetical protein